MGEQRSRVDCFTNPGGKWKFKGKMVQKHRNSAKLDEVLDVITRLDWEK